MPYAEIDLLTDKLAIRVATDWNEKELIKAIPGARYVKGAWWLPLTWPACLQLRGTFKKRLIIGEMLNTWAKKLRAEYVDPALKLRSMLEPAMMKPDDMLYPFQRVAVGYPEIEHSGFMAVAGSGILGDDMGCGKTIETLSYLSYLEQTDNPYPALIICPNSLKTHWEARLNEWVPNAEVYVVEGTAHERSDILEFASTSDCAVVIINYESLRTMSRQEGYGDIRLKKCKECAPHDGDNIRASSCQVHPKALNGFDWRVIILDEAHRIKSPQSQQTRATWALCHQDSVQHVWALTGTPIERNIGDLWSIMYAVRKEEYPVKGKFVDRYGISSWNAFGGVDIVGLHPDTTDEFHAFFGPRFRRMIKDIVLPQLPPKTYTTRYVEMSATQAKMYRELESSLMCRTPDGKLLIAQSALGARTRLAQLASATCKITNIEDAENPDTWTVELTEPSSKIDELVDVLKEIENQRVVVAADHSKLIDLAAMRLRKEGISCLTITGDVSVYDRQKALTALNNGHIQVLLFTTKAGGVGLDMSVASHLIWLQHPWSLIDYLQTEDRVRRIGSEKHDNINIIHIITIGTIEEDRLERLEEKLSRLDEITQDRKARIDAGLDVDISVSAFDEAMLTIGPDLGR